MLVGAVLVPVCAYSLRATAASFYPPQGAKFWRVCAHACVPLYADDCVLVLGIVFVFFCVPASYSNGNLVARTCACSELHRLCVRARVSHARKLVRLRVPFSLWLSFFAGMRRTWTTIGSSVAMCPLLNFPHSRSRLLRAGGSSRATAPFPKRRSSPRPWFSSECLGPRAY